MIVHEDQFGSDSTHTRLEKKKKKKKKLKTFGFKTKDQTSDSTRHTRTHQGQLAGLFVPLDLIASWFQPDFVIAIKSTGSGRRDGLTVPRASERQDKVSA
jgi:hypothetical protein